MNATHARSIFDTLFKEVNGFSISRHAREEEKAMGQKDLTYGEIEHDSFLEILAETHPQKHEIFYDMGCGTGKAVILAALQNTFAEAKGVEILTDLYNKAESIKKQFEHLTRDEHIQTKITFLHNDFFEIDPSDGDVFFYPSTCFSTDMMQEIDRSSQSYKSGSRIIVLTKELKGDHLELIHRKQHAMSWGETTVIIYRVT